MMTYYAWFFLFAVIAYLIVVDPNFTRYIDLLFKAFRFNYEKAKWILLNDPRNPIIKWIMWRNALKMAKELQKEYDQRNPK